MGAGFGAFGKIPSLGDFFRINAPTGFISVWDNWLQESLLHGRSTLGDNWNDCYLSAPIWRFTLSADLAGPHKILGVLMPSIDRVGRQFPLTLLTPLETQGHPVTDHFLSETIFSQLETLALDALEDGFTRDDLENRLTEIPAPDPCTQTPLRPYQGAYVSTNGDSAIMASGYASALVDQPSVWRSDVDGQPRTMICAQLPDGAEILGLFDKNAPIWTETAAI